jgi:hypothetical protein
VKACEQRLTNKKRVDGKGFTVKGNERDCLHAVGLETIYNQGVTVVCAIPSKPENMTIDPFTEDDRLSDPSPTGAFRF